MINIDEIRTMPRSEMVFLNVFTHICLFPASCIKRVEVKTYERTYAIRVCFVSLKTSKEFSHVFNFYRYGEENEALRFIELLSSHYTSFSVVGDEIELTN